MFNRIKNWFKEQSWSVIIIVILMIIVVISALVMMGFYIWALITYGNTPLAEIPGWVIWILC